jgi:hypothetical protein
MEKIVRKFRSFKEADYARSEHFELAVIVGYSLSCRREFASTHRNRA